MDLVLIAISVLLAATLGHAAHGASLCAVKAVAEVMSSGRAYMLASFAKTILWTIAVTLPLIWLLPAIGDRFGGWAFSWYAVVGGFIFGVGATMNGGCAISTLTKICDGRLDKLASLAGFLLGIAGTLHLLSSMPAPVRTASVFMELGAWVPVLVAATTAWALWEAARLWRTRSRDGPAWSAVLATGEYRLSTAAALLGLSNGVLYAVHGPWAYTSTVNRGMQAMMGDGMGPSVIFWLLFAAFVGGMELSSWRRGGFRPTWSRPISWVQGFAGGTLMGIGIAMVPGGNDVLMFHGIPSLSAHALPAFAAMIGGMAIVMVVYRMAGGTLPVVDCSGDVCRTP